MSKRLLVDVGHPAHVHFFRNPIKAWVEKGYDVAITARYKDVTTQLLDLYGLHYAMVSQSRSGNLGLAVELIEHDAGVLKVAREHGSKILMGTSVSITHVAKLVGGKSIVFNEDDADVARTFTRLAYPFADAIVTPTCLGEDHGQKHVTYEGYQKLSYLHPEVFSPNPAIRQKLAPKGEPYFIVRLVSLQAAHDRGEKGFSVEVTQKLLKLLSRYGTAYISSEKKLPEELKPFQLNISPTEMHDALAFSSLFIGDSQSMAVEAAILGIPAIRYNSFAKRCSVLQELQHKYGLTYAFLPDEQESMFLKVTELLEDSNLSIKWQEKRSQMLSEKINVARWVTDFIDNYQ